MSERVSEGGREGGSERRKKTCMFLVNFHKK